MERDRLQHPGNDSAGAGADEKPSGSSLKGDTGYLAGYAGEVCAMRCKHLIKQRKKKYN